MRTEWFALSLKSGELKRAALPRAARPIHWIERDIENIMALNPEFLGVEDHLPLRLGGERKTVTSPDQAYVDTLGRVVLVEAKRIRAGLRAMAQVLAYADHWRLLPVGEINKGLRCLADEGLSAEQFGRALSELQAWADGKAHRSSSFDENVRLGRNVVRRLKISRFAGSRNVRSYAKACWEQDCLPFVGAPGRVVVVAPDFNDECIEFAEALSERRSAVDLLKVDILKTRGAVYVGRTWVHRDEYADPTWRLLRHIWSRHPGIRDRFVLNGWADALNGESFSLSAKDITDARLWFCASDRCADVWTTVPSGWYSSDRKRRKELRKVFLGAMPRNCDRTEMYEVGAWVGWQFKLPAQSAEAECCICEVAEAVHKVLISHASAACQHLAAS